MNLKNSGRLRKASYGKWVFRVLFFLISLSLIPLPAFAAHDQSAVVEKSRAAFNERASLEYDDVSLGKAMRGELDLSAWLHEGKRTAAALDGEWEFYWNNLLEPEDFQASTLNDSEVFLPEPQMVPVPRPWTDYKAKESGEALPNEGYATFRLRVYLSETLTLNRQTLGIYPKSIASSYRIWINGSDKGGNGIVGQDRAGEVPGSYPKTIYFEPQAGWNEIIIQVSNFSQRNAGIWQSVEFGMAEAISWLRVARVSAQVFIVGIFFVMGLYYLLVYFNRRQELSALFFGLLCLSVGIRTIVLGESTALFLLPGLPWEWVVKTEYLSISMTALMLILFVHREYPQESFSLAPRIGVTVMLACMSLILALPAYIYTYYLTSFIWGVLLPVLLYCTYTYGLSALRRRKGSFTNAIGFLIFTVFALNDMLFYSGFLATDDLLSIGLFAFLLTQALNLSARFSRAMLETERLTAELQESNRSLERTVEERTSSLRESNEKLQKAYERMEDMEQFRLRLLSNISHELKTPITSIKGFAKALRDAIITSEAPKYANRIFERSLLLERLIHDLIELTKLETKQAQFNMLEARPRAFFKDLFVKYEWELQEKGIHSELVLPQEENTDKKYIVLIDRIRIEQVLANLVSNAIRHTPSGGKISLILRLEEPGEAAVSSGRAIITVRDTGAGIEPQMHKVIFERFGQAIQPLGTDHHGTGLGLAICKEIVHYHNGEIWVNSESGAGSEFSFYLPMDRKRK